MQRLRRTLEPVCLSLLVLGLTTQGHFSSAQSLLDGELPVQLGEWCSDLELGGIYPVLEAITVRVLTGQTWGSGVLVARQGNTYSIATNDHVLRFGSSSQYRVEMPDGIEYATRQVASHQFVGHDLALLEIESQNQYVTASFATALELDEPVFAAGFPLESMSSCPSQLNVTQGKVAMLAGRSFNNGYQIGYSNQILNGMSGGPLVNAKGEVVAINGMHAYPLWGNPYVYADGSIAPEELRRQFSQWSWGIPIQTFLELSSQSGTRLPLPLQNTDHQFLDRQVLFQGRSYLRFLERPSNTQ